MRRTIPTLMFAALAAGAGCQREQSGMSGEAVVQLTEEERGKVVAKVGDVVITLEDFERRLNQQSPFARSRYDSLERKKEFLDSLVRFELLALEAKARGHHKDPDVELAHKQALVRALTAKEVADLVKMDDVTDADVEAWYAEHKAEFIKPAEARAAHILMPDEASAKGLLVDLQAEIAAAPGEAQALFEKRAKLASTDAKTADRGGDLGWFGEPGQGRVDRGPAAPIVPPAVATAAFALKADGELHPAPIQTSQGWHIVQRTGYRRPFERGLDEVRSRIRTTLFRQKKAAALEQYVADLRAKAGVQIDEALLDQAKTAPQGQFNPRMAPPHLRPGAEGAPPLPTLKPPMPAPVGDAQ
ncbi:MAG: peptidyl-prolyl cis-trans isomerase [Myxococcales bacterium]|nr:peptidyl-prolyl cis-trans isomerase [Myxococcales bacterium]MCB9522979.1 peptidyl-prolyl cis-trans isomerase [Myxococcales bacterium]